nr:hypothetical protein [Anaerolinea sp.]
MNALPARRDVPVEYTWDLASLFADLAAWEQAFQAVDAALPGLQGYRGRLGESPALLLEWLETSQALRQQVMKVVMYARLNYAVDASDQERAALNSRAGGLMARASAATAFEEPELMALGFDRLRRWVSETPGLTVYAHHFDKLERRAPHVRSAEVEELFSQLLEPFQTASATHGILANADLAFKPARASDSTQPVEVTHSKMRSLLASPDRKLRKTGWQSYADAHLAYKNTMANCLAAGIKQDVFTARARRYGSALEAAMEGSTIPV